MKSFKRLLFILLSLGITTIAWGAEMPAYYPASFNKHGTIDRISINTAEIVINDSLQSLSTNIKVHSLVTEHSSIHVLKKGMSIGYSTITMRNGNRDVVEIWILPKNHKPFSE